MTEEERMERVFNSATPKQIYTCFSDGEAYGVAEFVNRVFTGTRDSAAPDGHKWQGWRIMQHLWREDLWVVAEHALVAGPEGGTLRADYRRVGPWGDAS